MELTMEKLSDLDQSAVREIETELQKLLADVFAVFQDEELSLAHERSPLSRLPPVA